MTRSKEKINDAFWNEYFRSYDILNMVNAYRNLLETVASKIDIRAGDKVLDAGTGTGNLAVLLAREGARVYGIDSSSHGLKIFQEKIPQGKTILHDLGEPIPIADSYFDHICCVNTLFALDHSKREAICKEFYRIMKPGGTIVMTNLLVGYKPVLIYAHHIRHHINSHGLLKTIWHIVSILRPTLKMFYYNRLMQEKTIATGDINFFKQGEQEDLLRRAGFREISQPEKIFADQAVLNTAHKI